MQNFDVRVVSKAVTALLAAPLANLLGRWFGQALTDEQSSSLALLIELTVTAVGVALAVYLAPKNKEV